MAGSFRIPSDGGRQLRRSNSAPDLSKGTDPKISDAEKKKLAKQQAKLDAEVKKQAKKEEAGTSGTAENPESPAGSKIGKGIFSRSSSSSDLSSFRSDMSGLTMPESIPNSPVHPMVTGKAPMMPHSASESSIASTESSIVPYSPKNSEAGHPGSGTMSPSESSSQYSPLNLDWDNFRKFQEKHLGGHFSPGRPVYEPGDKNTLHARWKPGVWRPYQSTPPRPLSPSSPSSMSSMSWSNFPNDPRTMNPPLVAPNTHSQEPGSPASSIGGHSLSENVPIYDAPGPSSPATRPGPFGTWNDNPIYEGPKVNSDRLQPPPGMFTRPTPIEVPPRRFGPNSEGEIVSLHSSPGTTPPLTPTAPGWLGENRAFFRDNPEFLQSNPTFFKDHPAIVKANPWIVQEYPHFAQQYPDIFTLPEPEKKNALSTKAKIGLAAVTGLAVGAAVTGVVLKPDEDSTEGGVQNA